MRRQELGNPTGDQLSLVITSVNDRATRKAHRPTRQNYYFTLFFFIYILCLNIFQGCIEIALSFLPPPLEGFTLFCRGKENQVGNRGMGKKIKFVLTRPYYFSPIPECCLRYLSGMYKVPFLPWGGGGDRIKLLGKKIK